MNEAELRELVRETIREVLAQRAAPKPRRALVMFTGALLGFDDAVESLHRVRETGIEMNFVQTESARRILDQRKIEALGMVELNQHIVRDHPLLIVPTLTVNTVAKVAAGMADGLPTNIMSEFIQMNRPIVAARNACCPDARDKTDWFPAMPETYKARLRRNIADVASYGVTFVSARGLHTAIGSIWAEVSAVPGLPPLPIIMPTHPTVGAPVARPATGQTGGTVTDCGLRLISHGTVQTLPEGTVLRIKPDALVTAMAQETAGRRSITFERG